MMIGGGMFKLQNRELQAAPWRVYVGYGVDTGQLTTAASVVMNLVEDCLLPT